MAYDPKEMARNLKLLATTPKEIERQQQIYQDTLAQIRADEATGNWSKNGIADRKQKALETRNKTCNALSRRMQGALDYVRQNNDYHTSETIDFQDPKLKDAMATVEYMGHDLSLADQAAMLNSFRGNVGALRVLQKAFQKNHLFMESAAGEMQKGIPQQALDEMQEVLSFAAYEEKKGGFSFPIERATFTKDAFQKQLDRLGLEDDGDPYSAILEAAADKIRADLDASLDGMTTEERTRKYTEGNAKIWALQAAQREVKEAMQRGENPAATLNRALSKLDTWGSPE